MEEFGKEFNIPCVHLEEMLEFDEKEGTFDLKGARNHFEFLKIMYLHREEMALLEQQMSDASKELENSSLHDSDSEDDGGDNESDAERENVDAESQATARSSAAHVKEKYFKKVDDAFKKACDKLSNQVWNAVHSASSETAFNNLISHLSTNRWWEDKKDHFNRTVLHYAVESDNATMIRVLLASGVNPNLKEGCGITPLHLAVIGKNTELCKLLVDGFALVDGLSFSSIPSPYKMATVMNLRDIVSLFEERLREQEMMNDELSHLISGGGGEGNCDEESQSLTESDAFMYERSKFCGFPTAVVGD